MTNKPRVYLDSCCFIDVVKESVGNLPTDRTNDVWYIKKILEAHRAGVLIAHTSVVAIGECVATERGQTSIAPEVQERFRSLLTSGQYVQLLNPTPETQVLVQKFRWEHRLVLGAIDALHFAASLERGCSEFITTDDRLKKNKVTDAIAVLADLNLKMIRASATTLLPDNYRQGSVLNA